MSSCYSRLPEMLYQYSRDDYLCDVTIVVCGGATVFAHSVVLSTVSSKLRAAFERTHSGGPYRKPNWGYRLTAEECTIESVQAILQFVYTGSMPSICNEGKCRSAKEAAVSQSSFIGENATLPSEKISDSRDEVVRNVGLQNALGILRAGQKLGLDPMRLANCLKTMMVEGPLNIEETTHYILTDEDVILDVVDKDPDAKSSLNLIETMRVTSQALPIVQKGQPDVSYLDVNDIDEKGAMRKNVSNVCSIVGLGDQSKFLPDCTADFNSTGAAKRGVRDCSIPIAFNTNALKPSLPLVDCNDSITGVPSVVQIGQTKDNRNVKESVPTKKLTTKGYRNSNFTDVYSRVKLPFIVDPIFNRTRSIAGLEGNNSLIAQKNDAPSTSTNSVNMSILDGVDSSLLVIEESIENLDSNLSGTREKNIAEKVVTFHQPKEKNKTRRNDRILGGDEGDSKTTCSTDPVEPTDDARSDDRKAKPYKCETCGRSFARRYTAVEHERLHSGERPYQCDRCGKRFTTCGDLTKHRRSQHGTIKPHVCSTCGKEMRTGREVADHKRLHEGGNRCPVCQKTFTRLHNMKEHLRGTHQGYKLFSCTQCDKKFVYSGSLRFHKKHHRMNNGGATTKKCFPTENPLSAEMSDGEKFSKDASSNKSTSLFGCSGGFNGEFKSTSLSSNDNQPFPGDVSDCGLTAVKYKGDKASVITGISSDSPQIEAMLRNGSLQDGVEINSMDELQDHVLVDFSMSGMIGFGAGE